MEMTLIDHSKLNSKLISLVHDCTYIEFIIKTILYIGSNASSVIYSILMHALVHKHVWMQDYSTLEAAVSSCCRQRNRKAETCYWIFQVWQWRTLRRQLFSWCTLHSKLVLLFNFSLCKMCQRVFFFSRTH